MISRTYAMTPKLSTQRRETVVQNYHHFHKSTMGGGGGQWSCRQFWSQTYLYLLVEFLALFDRYLLHFEHAALLGDLSLQFRHLTLQLLESLPSLFTHSTRQWASEVHISLYRHIYVKNKEKPRLQRVNIW